MSNYLLNILIWLDEGVNTIFVPTFRYCMSLPPAAGNAHYTVSQTLAELRLNGSLTGCIGCAILTWIQNKIFKIKGDHCINAMQGMPENITSE